MVKRIGDSDFGLYELGDPNSLFYTILEKNPKVSYLQGKELLFQVYENVFGIYDYLGQDSKEKTITSPDQKHPLSSIEMHPAELNSGSEQKYDQISRVFADCKISTYFGISWIEFMSLPVEHAERLLRIAQDSNRSANAVQTAVMNDLNKAANNK